MQSKRDLWPLENPGGWSRADVEHIEHTSWNYQVRHAVSQPTLEVFPAPQLLEQAPTVMICPGGGYHTLAEEHEGTEFAQFLNDRGIHAALLRYRIPRREQDIPLHLAPLQDAQRGLRLLRSLAAHHGWDANKVGMMGFSAGGHLTAVTANTKNDAYPAVDEADTLPARPDFTVLIYPAYLVKKGSMTLVSEVSVSESTPPAFLIHTLDDDQPVEGSLAYVKACHDHHVSAEVHVFPQGGHGYGLRSLENRLRDWPELMAAWLKDR